MADLDEWITRESLLECAGAKVFRRGEIYFAEEAVESLRDAGDRVAARVYGSEPYFVELWTTGEELLYDCTCPHAEEGNFCKHCVALGLALLAEREGAGQEDEVSKREAWETLRDFLEEQDPEALIDYVLEAAWRDDATYRRLLDDAGVGAPDD